MYIERIPQTKTSTFFNGFEFNYKDELSRYRSRLCGKPQTSDICDSNINNVDVPKRLAPPL